jgi:hypothetical protein
MNISVYRINYSNEAYTYFKYDNSNILPLLTKNDFTNNYTNICKNICINNSEVDDLQDSIKFCNLMKEYGIYLKIGDIVFQNNQSYYYDNPLVKFDIF